MTALVLTPQPLSASVLLQLTGAPDSITNLLPNPGFEDDVTGWQEQGTGTAAPVRTTAQKDTGAASALVAVGTDNGLALRTGLISIGADAPGKTFGARLRVRSTTATSVSLALRFIQADGATTTNTVTGPTVALAANTWTTISVPAAVAGALTANARVHLNKLDTTARNLYVDSGVLRRIAAWATFDPAFYFTGTLPASLTITRTDANGTAPVRLRTGQAPIAGALTVVDYEAALTGAVTYDVVDTQQTRTTASTSLAGVSPRPQITGVQLPQLTYSPELVTGYDASREAASTVHRVVNRDDPVIVLGPTRTREGNLAVWCRSYVDAADVARVLALGRILMLRQLDYAGLDMYFLAQSIETTPLDSTTQGWRWQTTCRYIEVRNPALPLLGDAGWTFDDVVATYPTFGALRSAFTDFNDLVVGP